MIDDYTIERMFAEVKDDLKLLEQRITRLENDKKNS